MFTQNHDLENSIVLHRALKHTVVGALLFARISVISIGVDWQAWVMPPGSRAGVNASPAVAWAQQVGRPQPAGEISGPRLGSGGIPGWAAPVLIPGCFEEEEEEEVEEEEEKGRGAFGTRHAWGRQGWRQPNKRINYPPSLPLQSSGTKVDPNYKSLFCASTTKKKAPYSPLTLFF